MAFIDKVELSVIGGRGGDGHRSFRHERYIAKGGPDGGDGGDGGDVIFRATDSHHTLSAFRHHKELKADDGQPGGTSRKHGKSGQDLIIDVPVGTQVSDEGHMIVDLITKDQICAVAQGGGGGFGNAHFTSSTRQAPNFAEKGEPGQKLTLTLELKLIADIGLVGLPNAGKSTLLARLSNARPEIADYPFTTLKPNLGVIDIDSEVSVLAADIPGLIEGAAEGKGLGHEFLKHIERTRAIVHLIDVYNPDIVKSYQTIRSELAAYSQKLAKLPEIVVITKVEGYDQTTLKDAAAKLRAVLKKKQAPVAISAQAGTNLDQLKFIIKKTLDEIKEPKAKIVKPSIPVISLSDTSGSFEVRKTDNGYQVAGQKIEQFARRTDFNNPEAVDRLLFILKRLGVFRELKRRGLETGQIVSFGQDPKDSFKF